jgi:hypothetical protein
MNGTVMNLTMAETLYYDGRPGFVDIRHLHGILPTSRLYTCIRRPGMPPVSDAAQ